MVTLLVEALSEAPVISKIDLGGNYTSDQSAICLIRLLILQAKQVRDTPIDQRLTAVYMGEVSFDQSKSIIQEKIIEDIAVVCGALRHANVKTRIRECFIRTVGATGMIQNSASVDRLYSDATGRKSDKIFLHKCDAALIASGQRSLSYAEVDKLIISDLVDQGALPLLSAKQEKLITEGMAGPGKKPNSGTETPQKPDQATPTATAQPPTPAEAEKRPLSSPKGPDASLSTNQPSTAADAPETHTPTQQQQQQQHQQPKKVQVKIRTPNRSNGGIAKNAPPVSSDNSRRVSEKSSEPSSVGVSTVPSRSESPRGRPSQEVTVASNPTPPPAAIINTSAAAASAIIEPSKKQPLENARTSKVNSLLTKINSSKSLVAKSPTTEPLSVGVTVGVDGVEGAEQREVDVVSPTREETQAMANEFQAKLDESRRHTATSAPSQRLEPHHPHHHHHHHSNNHTGMTVTANANETTAKTGRAPALDDFVSTPTRKDEPIPTGGGNLSEHINKEDEGEAAAVAVGADSAAATAASTAAANAGDRRPVSRPRAKVVMKQRASSDKAPGLIPGLDQSNNNDKDMDKDNDNPVKPSIPRVTLPSNQEASVSDKDDDDDAVIASTIVQLEGELLTQERKIARLENKLVTQGVDVNNHRNQRVTDTTDDDEVEDKKHTRSPSHALHRDEEEEDDDVTSSTLPVVTTMTANMTPTTTTTPTANPTSFNDAPVINNENNDPEPPAEDTKESKVSALRARLNARKKAASGGGSIDQVLNLLSTSAAASGKDAPLVSASSTSVECANRGMEVEAVSSSSSSSSILPREQSGFSPSSATTTTATTTTTSTWEMSTPLATEGLSDRSMEGLSDRSMDPTPLSLAVGKLSIKTILA